MISYYGDFAEDDTVNIPFNTFSSDDPTASVTVTDLAAADIKVHKDAGLTQIVTDGATVIINFDSITGNHMVTIDTSAHADYTTGSEYSVRLEGITVDGATLNVWIGAFSIERAGGVLALLKGSIGLAAIDTVVDSILVDTGTTLDTKLNNIQGATFSTSTDSLEALRNRGDSAWTGSATTSNSGTAQAGAAGSITLESGASATDNLYNGQIVFISAGTGAGQSRAIDGYTGSSKVATVITNWVTNPDATSVYEVTPDDVTEVTAAPTVAAIADAVWDENTSGHTTASTFGEQCKNDIDAILVDTAVIGASAGADIGADIAAVKVDTAAILVDTAVIGATGSGLTSLATQASVNTIGTNVDAILVDTATTLQGELDAIQAAVITNAAGVDIAADIIAMKVDTAAVLVDTGTTLDTKINDIDTVVDAVKVVTDKFAFTVSNQVDSNVESLNAVTVLGAGTSGDKWRA